MRRILSFIILMLALSLYAEDEEDIFADIDLGRMEVDANYEDDFDAIEKGQTFSAPNSMLTHPYDAYSERLCAPEGQSLGALVSQETIARVFHMTLFPKAHFKIWEIKSSLGLPLRFPIYDNLASTGHGIRKRGFLGVEELITPRSPDFRSFADIFRLVRHVEFGALEQSYYLALVRDHNMSLGQGELMREMSTDYLYDHDYLFAHGHANFFPVRIEGALGPIPRANILALNVKVEPFAGFGKALENLSFDATYVGDYRAPGAALIQEEAFVLDNYKRLIERDKGVAQGLSLGAASLYEPTKWLGSKPYISLGQLWLSGFRDQALSYGLAFNFGHDAHFYLSQDKRSQILLRTEARFFSDNYQPNYFGDNYMLDRVSIFENSDMPISKAQLVSTKSIKDWRFGHMLELGFAYDKIFNTKLSYENARIMSTNTPLDFFRKVKFHANLLAFERVKVRTAYEAHAIGHLKDIFDFTKSRGLISLQGQVKILSFLYFDSWIKHGFGVANMYEASKSKAWLSSKAETRSLNFGLGVQLAMAF